MEVAHADPLERCLQAILEAADAADALGLPTGSVRAVHADAVRRLGFPGDLYVLALVGGTGVGKSSLLNALAGATVSPASVRRPTTDEPVAWVPSGQRDDLAPLLAWLGVRDIREHAVDERADGLGSVAILDLPDMDSMATAHRTRVEAILPRVDAVAWVTDPEKYHDSVLFDAFLRSWLPRLDRQVVVVNKADRLSPDDGGRVRRDLEADLRNGALAGDHRDVPVVLTSALPMADGGRTAMPSDGTVATPGIEPLRRWLADGVAAKAIVRARIAASLVDLGRDLARDAGLDPSTVVAPFLTADDRTAALDEATVVVLRAVDLPGLERQAEAATRARARARGAGPAGRLTSLVYRASGRAARVADPEGFLVRWRERGSLAPAVETLRAALSRALAAASPGVRPALAAALDPAGLRQGLERAVDRAVAGVGPLEAPVSRWWPVIGLLQTLATAGIVLSAAWVVVWILGAPQTGSIEVPLLGPIPTPFASLVGFVVAGYLSARLLGAHAGWLGRRWAGGVRDRVAGAVREEIEDRGLSALDALEGSRRRLWTALSTVDGSCGGRHHPAP